MTAPITILGGGPAGLAVAFYAHRAGVPFRLYEAAPEVGGLCRTFAFEGHRYDAGAHRFHDRDPEVTADVRALLGDELLRVEAPSQILHRGRFVDFPPRPLGWLLHQGVREGLAAAADLVASRLRPRPERTFEDHALNRYGRRLAAPLLLDYSQKLWGLPPSELATDVATRRLSGLSLGALVAELLGGRSAQRHLDGDFLYPRSGYGAITASLVRTLPPAALATEHAVSALHVERGRVRAMAFTNRPSVDVPGRLVSTLPLPTLVRLLGDALPESVHALAATLRFRHLRIVFLRLGVPHCSANATIYLPDPRLCVSRVSEPKNRSAAMAPPHETGLVCEMPCFAGDAIHGMDDADLAARIVRELDGAGVIDAGRVLGWRHHLLPNAYPVYALGYADVVRRVRAALGGVSDLDLLGRNGTFWYSHLHDQLRSARDYARSLRSARGASDAEHLAAHADVRRETVPGPAAA